MLPEQVQPQGNVLYKKGTSISSNKKLTIFKVIQKS